ncbi:hypothetical protein COLO4_06095 [Corchorus olitorius]|uniref:Uncharacterized protein n=1 Tax=Corchorus olitorius TaxID=93759 RepID=A0A1R3KNY5_9ROSI|nr:hypothetical protein COLO4_06095 [Corchorus olitorius]
MKDQERLAYRTCPRDDHEAVSETPRITRWGEPAASLGQIKRVTPVLSDCTLIVTLLYVASCNPD